jgi:hypothetical protein
MTPCSSLSRPPSPYPRDLEFGSGSLEQDGPLSVVAMKKEKQTGLVHDHRLGKGQRHAHKTGQALAQRVIPALHMSRFPCFLSYGCMLLLWDHCPVSRPKVREAMSLAVVVWNGLPQALTCLFAAIAQCIGNHLPCLAAQGNPNPGLVRFFEHKRPQLIELQRRGSGILWIGGD